MASLPEGFCKELCFVNCKEVLRLEAGIRKKQLDDWDFDALGLSVEQQFAYLLSIFRPHMQELGVKASTMLSFFGHLHWFYSSNGNPFHNFKHAVSVAYACNYLSNHLAEFRLLGFPFKLAFLLAGLGHDVGHTGRTNSYEVNSKSFLARTYGCKSTLEQHHASLLFRVLELPENDILLRLPFELYYKIRQTVIRCIMATDMQRHFQLVKQLEEPERLPVNLRSADLLDFYLPLLLHAADLSGSAKSRQVAEQWSRLITEEFIRQHELEGKNGLPVTPYYKDLHLPVNFYKSEVGFLRGIVLPLFKGLHKLHQWIVQEMVSKDMAVGRKLRSKD